MGRHLRRTAVLGAAVALLAAGAATAAITIRTITLKSGHCTTVGKIRVCAASARTQTRRYAVTVTGPAATTVTVTNTVTAPAPAPAVAFGDGTFRVGVEIQPGTYEASSGTTCYWARLSGFSGGLGDIIANGIGAKQTIVTIEPGDVGFKSDGCGSWTKVG